MSDANKYINTYVDHAVGMLHEYVNTILQLRTQLKLSNDLNGEKDAIIGRLGQELESSKQENDVISKLQNDIKLLQETNEGLAAKQSHLHTALNQIADMKRTIQEKDSKIAELEKKFSKKAINSKKKTTISEVSDPSDIKQTRLPEKNDDF